MKMPLLCFLLLLSRALCTDQINTAPNPQLQQRLDAVAPKVETLSGDGDSGKVRAILNVALEKTKACLEAGDSKDAGDLLNDIESALAKNPHDLVSPSNQTNTISAIRPPHSVIGNPYIANLVAGAKEELSKPTKSFAKNTAALNTFSGLVGDTGSRSSGDELQAWLWLFSNPASPLKDNPKVLERFLRLAHAYTDAMEVHGGVTLARPHEIQGPALVGGQGSVGSETSPLAGQGIFDDFAIAPVSCALREFAQLYPFMLLPSQKAQWDRAMNIGGSIMWAKAKERQGTYANIDLALAFQMLNFGLYLNNKEYLDKSHFLYEA